MIEVREKNMAAVLLGRRGRGIPKTLTEAQRLVKSERMRQMRQKAILEQKSKKGP
jgi:hypothetical protein